MQLSYRWIRWEKDDRGGVGLVIMQQAMDLLVIAPVVSCHMPREVEHEDPMERSVGRSNIPRVDPVNFAASAVPKGMSFVVC